MLKKILSKQKLIPKKLFKKFLSFECERCICRILIGQPKVNQYICILLPINKEKPPALLSN